MDDDLEQFDRRDWQEVSKMFDRIERDEKIINRADLKRQREDFIRFLLFEKYPDNDGLREHEKYTFWAVYSPNDQQSRFAPGIPRAAFQNALSILGKFETGREIIVESPDSMRLRRRRFLIEAGYKLPPLDRESTMTIKYAYGQGNAEYERREWSATQKLKVKEELYLGHENTEGLKEIILGLGLRKVELS